MSCVLSSCVICGIRFEECDLSLSDGVGRKELLSQSTQLKLAFGLLCKLLNVTAGISSLIEENENNELYQLLEEFPSMCSSTKSKSNGEDEDGRYCGSSALSTTTCELCSVALQEVLRLERIIENLKVSQMVHVNVLKRSLLLRNLSLSHAPDKNDRNHYWEVVTSQLVACLQNQKNVLPSSAKRLRSEKAQTTATSIPNCGPASRKRRKPLSGKSPVSPPRAADANLPILKPCFVELTRLNAAAVKSTSERSLKNLKPPTSKSVESSVSPTTTSFSDGGRVRHTRQSKQKAYNLFKETLGSSHHHHHHQEDKAGEDNVTQDTDWNVNDDEEASISGEHDESFGDGDDNFEDIDLFPLSNDIKEENNEIDPLADENDEEMEINWQYETQDQTWNEKVKQEGKATEKPMAPQQPAKKETPKNRMCFITANIYLYDCTLVKFCSTERHFICQEPDCGTVLPGTILDGSIFQNIRAHVDLNHKPIEDEKIRSCPLCPVQIRGGARKLRKHIARSHGDSSSKIQTTVCEVCGKCGFANLILEHKWSHRTFEEKVAALEAGEVYPAKLKQILKLKPHDPFHSVIFGEAESSKRGKSPRKLEKVAKAESRPENKINRIVKSLDGNDNSKVKIRETARRNKRRFILLAENVYLYNCTLVKFSAELGQHMCQEPECGTLVPGTVQAGSLFRNIRLHVDQEHTRTNDNPSGKVRPCPFCSYKCSESPKAFRVHLTNDHSKNNVLPWVCEVCGISGFASNIIRHSWSHKSFEEKVQALRNGELYPFRLKQQLSKKNPLYSFVFGRDAIKKNTKQEIPKEEPQKRIRPEPKKAKRPRKPLKPKPNSKLDFVHIFPENTYLCRYSLFRYSVEERQFICQEPDCSERIPEWDSCAVSKIKSHAFEKHYVCSWSRRFLGEFARTCPMCLELVEGPQRFLNHMLDTHRDETLTGGAILCEICMKPLSCSEDYLHHLATHGRSDDDKKFDKAKAEPSSCPTCGKIFSKLSHLKLHLLQHTSYASRKKFPCPHCNLQLLSATGVKIHVERVHQPKAENVRKCTVPGCDKEFFRRDHTKYKDHLRQHKGETPYICDVCGKNFSSNLLFANHKIRTHGPKKYQCEKCGMKYACSSHLSRHYRNNHAKKVM